MPGGPTNKIKGLGVLCRETKGLESLGVGHRWDKEKPYFLPVDENKKPAQ